MANPWLIVLIQLTVVCRGGVNTYFLGYFWFLIQVDVDMRCARKGERERMIA
jgi:hypothetical protein